MSAPSFIPIPPPPRFDVPDPPTPYFTPPESPLDSPNIFFTPPASPMDIPMPDASDDPDILQPSADLTLSLALEDASLSTLDKIYLYSRSDATFHRVFIASALPHYLLSISPQDAIEYVLPLLTNLAMDDDESVKEALASALVPVIWWFFAHCQIIPDDPNLADPFPSSSTSVTIPVQAFSPILGTLLLSSNPRVGGTTRTAIVDLLSRMKRADDKERGIVRVPTAEHSPNILYPWEISDDFAEEDGDLEELYIIGLFGTRERALFTEEILQQVVIGMARLDDTVDPARPQSPFTPEQPTRSLHPTPSPRQTPSPRHSPRDATVPSQSDSYNPYFPPIPSQSSPQTSRSTPQASSNSSSYPRSPPANARFSPGTEFPPSIAARSRSPSSHSPSIHSMSSCNATTASMDVDMEGFDVDVDDEQAAVGRLSSMSLMAAVTAGGTLDEATQRSFVQEVERVGRDPVYWVRREASFALGALAKVVPQEVIMTSLLPLFCALRYDPVWHVRHSALFALPALLSRLPYPQRRRIALETMLALSTDAHSAVRSGALEAIGEVIYSFHDDPAGPPQELISLFLGRYSDVWLRSGLSAKPNGLHLPPQTSPSDSFYMDPKRPVICAFNFPAVALTLGSSRWPELRDAYLEMTRNPSCGVQRTLVASLGEIAKVIGKERALEDLVGLWRTGIRSEDDEVRLKAVESLKDLCSVVGGETTESLLSDVLSAWDEGVLRSWRERATLEQTLCDWANLAELPNADLAIRLVFKGLEDGVAAVRESAISSLVGMFDLLAKRQDCIRSTQGRLVGLAESSTHRRRMTFIACQQALLSRDGGTFHASLDAVMPHLTTLANDAIEGVKIGLARLIGSLYDDLHRRSVPVPKALADLALQLSIIGSSDVRSYLPNLFPTPLSAHEHQSTALSTTPRSQQRLVQLTTFSRPPNKVPGASHHPNGRNLASNSTQDSPSPGITCLTNQSDNFVPLLQDQMGMNYPGRATEFYPRAVADKSDGFPGKVLGRDEGFHFPTHAGPMSAEVDVPG